MRFSIAISAIVPLAALSSASPVEKRQASDKFQLYFGPGADPSNAIQFVNGALNGGVAVANPVAAYYNQSEPFILDSDFVFFSVYNSPTGGQALVASDTASTALQLTVPHTGYVVPDGFTRTGFQVIYGKLAINGTTDHFWKCNLMAPPGGEFILYQHPGADDDHEISEGGCFKVDYVTANPV